MTSYKLIIKLLTSNIYYLKNQKLHIQFNILLYPYTVHLLIGSSSRTDLIG